MQLETARLTLIPLSPADAEVFHQINVDPFVRKHLWDDCVISRETTDGILEQVVETFSNLGWGLWLVTETATGCCLGYAGLWCFFDESDPQLMYALLPEHTGQGYAVEAARRIADWALESLPMGCLMASMDVANRKSAAVCERLGMQRQEVRLVEGREVCFYRLDA